MGGEQGPMDGQDPMMGGGQEPMDGQDPMMGGGQEPMDGQDPMMDGEQQPMDGQDPMMGDEQIPTEGGDDSTVSIIQQLSDEDREAVRAYAESMLGNKNSDNEMSPVNNEPMMESVIFTKRQLNKLMENFGPTEDEIQKKDNRKPLMKKKEQTVSKKSPFNSPKFD